MQPLDAPATLEGATSMTAPAAAPEMPLQAAAPVQVRHHTLATSLRVSDCERVVAHDTEECRPELYCDAYK